LTNGPIYGFTQAEKKQKAAKPKRQPSRKNSARSSRKPAVVEDDLENDILKAVSSSSQVLDE
jgi:hypothetical protein